MKTKIYSKLDTKAISHLPLQFGSVVDFNGQQFIYSHNMGPLDMLITMDGTSYNLYPNSELTWLYQLPVKFYKGFDYAITDAGVIIRQHGSKTVNFCDKTRTMLIARANDSAAFYLKRSYDSGRRSLDEYHMVISQCMKDHVYKHQKQYLIRYV